MKKCLHLKKTKPHWRRKPPKVITWKDRIAVERRERERKLSFQAGFLHVAAATAALLSDYRKF
jgi:hypothetical protein